jgi:glycerophosphoryl diester phosphodiesterase
MLNNILKCIVVSILFIGCNQQKSKEPINQGEEVEIVKTISENAKKVSDYIKIDIVIAHRGSTYWTPEETEPAYLWARNIGADYLELDVQLTKDGVLVAFHDNDLSRTTNIAKVFPEKTKSEINDFTLKELRSLDAGSWFNKTFPDRAKEGYIDLKIMTLKDVVKIAEGFRIKKENGKPVKELVEGIWNGKYTYEKDPNDNGNRPGIYVETKHPKLNSEKILAKEITDYGWNINSNPKTIATQQGKVAISNTNARLILQSFSPESILQLEKELPNIPKCLLLWKPEMKGDLKDVYKRAIDFAINNNVQIIGSSISGEPNNYEELTAPWMVVLIHNAGMLIHPYTFDTNEQLNEYKDKVDAVFTNRADLALEFYKRKSENTPQDILIALGYN